MPPHAHTDAQAALDRAGAVLPRGFHSFFQSDQFGGFVQLIAIQSTRASAVQYCAFILKTSIGSMPILCAKSSSAQQVRYDACWLPGARQARCVPVLVETGVRVSRMFGIFVIDVRLRCRVHRGEAARAPRKRFKRRNRAVLFATDLDFEYADGRLPPIICSVARSR